MAAISQERGVDLVMTFPKSVTIQKFKTFLDELRSKHFLDDIVLFMDRMSVHRSPVIKDRMDELGIAYIYNPPYSP